MHMQLCCVGLIRVFHRIGAVSSAIMWRGHIWRGAIVLMGHRSLEICPEGLCLWLWCVLGVGAGLPGCLCSHSEWGI
jgi:hypothetical protein